MRLAAPAADGNSSPSMLVVEWLELGRGDVLRPVYVYVLVKTTHVLMIALHHCMATTVQQQHEQHQQQQT